SPDPRLQLRYGVLDSEFVAAANAHAAKPQYNQHDADGPFDAVSQVPARCRAAPDVWEPLLFCAAELLSATDRFPTPAESELTCRGPECVKGSGILDDDFVAGRQAAANSKCSLNP